MTKDLNCLKQPFQDSVRKLCDLCKDIPDFRVAEACRTYEDQAEKVRLGYSKTMNSKHLIGEAVDIYVKDYDMSLYDKVYEVCKKLPYIIYPYYDLSWGWDAMHFQFDANKKGVEMTDEQKHREAMEWAFRSIYLKEPTAKKIDYLAEKYSDINEARQAMIVEECPKFTIDPENQCPPCPEPEPCPPPPACPEPEVKVVEVCKGLPRNRWWHFKKFLGIK